MASPLEPVLSNFSFILERNARLVTTVCALSIIIFAVVPLLEQNYRAYIDAGDGGLPPNLYGWAKSSFLKIFLSCETIKTDMYLSDPNKDTWLDPPEITKRHGERPTFNWHPVPSRQITQRADSTMNEVRLTLVYQYLCDPRLKPTMKKIQKLLPKYARANPNLIEIALSPQEKHHDALVIHRDRPTPHRVATVAKREILHVHEGTDWSLHCLLSPLDCKLGKRAAVPRTYEVNLKALNQ